MALDCHKRTSSGPGIARVHDSACGPPPLPPRTQRRHLPLRSPRHSVPLSLSRGFPLTGGGGGQYGHPMSGGSQGPPTDGRGLVNRRPVGKPPKTGGNRQRLAASEPATDRQRRRWAGDTPAPGARVFLHQKKKNKKNCGRPQGTPCPPPISPCLPGT